MNDNNSADSKTFRKNSVAQRIAAFQRKNVPIPAVTTLQPSSQAK